MKTSYEMTLVVALNVSVINLVYGELLWNDFLWNDFLWKGTYGMTWFIYRLLFINRVIRSSYVYVFYR